MAPKLLTYMEAASNKEDCDNRRSVKDDVFSVAFIIADMCLIGPNYEQSYSELSGVNKD